MPATTTNIVAHEAEELAADELAAPDRFREEHEDRALVDLLVHQAGGHEDGDDRGRRALTATRPKSRIMRPPWPRLMLASHRLADDHRQSEEHDHRQDAVADRLLERVGGDGEHSGSRATTSMKNASRSTRLRECLSTVPSHTHDAGAHDRDARAELGHVGRMCELKRTVLPRRVQPLG